MIAGPLSLLAATPHSPRLYTLVGVEVRMDRRSEHKLVEAAAKGDRRAAEALVLAHQRSLYLYLLRFTGRVDMAEDIAQDAFVRALSNLDRFDPRYRFSTWLFTIAKRLYLNLLDRKRAEQLPEEGLIVTVKRGTEATPAGTASVAERSAAARDSIQAALLTLPTVQREVLILCHQLNWPIWLVAEHLRIPVGTVKSHLHRGRERLRSALKQAEADRRVLAPGMEQWTMTEGLR